MTLHDAQNRAAFLATLDWLIALTQRYASPIEFGLVHIAFGSHENGGETVQHLEEFSAGLRRAFRKTDLLARDGNDFWIIVPYTPATEKIYDKVLEILQSTDHDGLHLIDRATSIFTLSALLKELDDNLKDCAAEELLDHLKRHKKTYARHLLELPSLAKVNGSIMIESS